MIHFLSERLNERLSGIEGKPDFADVYSYLSKFVRPFAMRDEKPKVWNGETMEWEADRQKETEKKPIVAKIRATAAEIRNNSQSNETKRNNENEL